MNPSAVPHFDQSGMPEGSMRILMSLRAVGEGHISSVAFREGIITDQSQLKLATEPPFATATDVVGRRIPQHRSHLRKLAARRGAAGAAASPAFERART